MAIAILYLTNLPGCDSFFLSIITLCTGTGVLGQLHMNAPNEGHSVTLHLGQPENKCQVADFAIMMYASRHYSVCIGISITASPVLDIAALCLSSWAANLMISQTATSLSQQFQLHLPQPLQVSLQLIHNNMIFPYRSAWHKYCLE